MGYEHWQAGFAVARVMLVYSMALGTRSLFELEPKPLPDEAVSKLGIKYKGKLLVERLTQDPRGAANVSSHFEPRSTEAHRGSGMVKLDNETIGEVLVDWKRHAAEHRRKLENESQGMRYDPVTKTYY